jgi:hypothetical protein
MRVAAVPQLNNRSNRSPCCSSEMYPSKTGPLYLSNSR